MAASPIPIASVPIAQIPSAVGTAWRIPVRQICATCQGQGCPRCRLSGWIEGESLMPTTMPVASVTIRP